ncbi:hypothetical protein ACFUN7_32660 [Streptomyces sp. NPDC057236]|uniref:hypothetical protein n=1 Tax=Streptomyces sp. NPDC057236 TaxID=3346059 RepID=UPI00362C80D5
MRSDSKESLLLGGAMYRSVSEVTAICDGTERLAKHPVKAIRLDHLAEATTVPANPTLQTGKTALTSKNTKQAITP